MGKRLKRVDEHSKVFLENVMPVRISRNFLEQSLISQIDPNSSTMYSTVMENTVTSMQNLQNIRRDASKICVELIRRRRYIKRKKTALAVRVEKGNENKKKESRKYHRSLRSSSFCWFVSLSQSSSCTS